MNKKRVFVVLPSYNCQKTLRKTLVEIPSEVDDIVLVDDCSTDDTLKEAKNLGVNHVYKHKKNLGYGANQKTCYDKALLLGADIVIMLHPDYQYDPKLIKSIINKFYNGSNVVFASRMRHGTEALKLGMPLYKYVANKALTLFQNLLLHQHLSEYHTGYRAYSREVLEKVDYKRLSNGFIFDNEIILELVRRNIHIDEIYCPAKYSKDSSSISFLQSVKYGMQIVIKTVIFKLKMS